MRLAQAPSYKCLTSARTFALFARLLGASDTGHWTFRHSDCFPSCWSRGGCHAHGRWQVSPRVLVGLGGDTWFGAARWRRRRLPLAVSCHRCCHRMRTPPRTTASLSGRRLFLPFSSSGNIFRSERSQEGCDAAPATGVGSFSEQLCQILLSGVNGPLRTART